MSVMIAAFISALLLSLLLGLFYNAWKYEIESIEQEEGGWQSRIVGAFTQEDMEFIKNFANVPQMIPQSPLNLVRESRLITLNTHINPTNKNEAARIYSTLPNCQEKLPER